MWTHVYALDIETDTSELTDAERAAGFTSRGLDPAITSITSIAVAGLPAGDLVLTGDEREMLTSLENALAHAPAGLLVTWNGAVFDLPFIDARSHRTGVRTGLTLTPDPLIVPKYQPTPGYDGGHSAAWSTDSPVPHAHLDLAYAMKDLTYHRGIPWGLKPTARAFGLDPIEVDRTAMHELTDDEMRAYVLSDAVVTRELAMRLLSAGLD